jgi:hypothetical protein
MELASSLKSGLTKNQRDLFQKIKDSFPDEDFFSAFPFLKEYF